MPLKVTWEPKRAVWCMAYSLSYLVVNAFVISSFQVTPSPGLLLDLLFDPEDGGDMFLWKNILFLIEIIRAVFEKIPVLFLVAHQRGPWFWD
jgi:hypothetical protein